MLNQVSTEPSHWSTVSFTIKQLAQIVSLNSFSFLYFSSAACLVFILHVFSQ